MAIFILSALAGLSCVPKARSVGEEQAKKSKEKKVILQCIKLSDELSGNMAYFQLLQGFRAREGARIPFFL